jgi:anaerobic selenocysteine-containing dehydrogenase
VAAIDVRETEAARQSDEAFTLRPGTDAALALAMMNVIVGEGLHDREFVAQHTLGFEALVDHLRSYTPHWASGVTGIAAERIAGLAHRYAAERPAMIVLGGSSMHKGSNGWHAGRAIACLPALTGNLGIAGGGFGPRHGARSHGQELTDIVALDRRPPGRYVPNQMSRVTEALVEGDVRVLLLLGTDMLGSFADAGRVAEGLARSELVVSYDLFMNETARRFADVVLPATAWLEEVGCKSTNTHLYLMEKAIEPPAEARSAVYLLRGLASRLGLSREFFPWSNDEGPLDAILDHASTGRARVASLRAEGGIRALQISHVAYPHLRFDTPSGKVEFYSERAVKMGLPALPVYQAIPESKYPLAFRQGRTLTHFHSFYDHGQALPRLAKLDPEPSLWISPADATARGLDDGVPIRIYNERGEFCARARVTPAVPAGTVWMRDGWGGLNRVTSGEPCLPDEVVDTFGFSGGQAAFDAMVEVAAANEIAPAD